MSETTTTTAPAVLTLSKGKTIEVKSLDTALTRFGSQAGNIKAKLAKVAPGVMAEDMAGDSIFATSAIKPAQDLGLFHKDPDANTRKAQDFRKLARLQQALSACQKAGLI